MPKQDVGAPISLIPAIMAGEDAAGTSIYALGTSSKACSVSLTPRLLYLICGLPG